MALYLTSPLISPRYEVVVNANIYSTFIMGANIAGIYGAQIFRSDDRLKYRSGIYY
jgi:hypothetical protein